MYTVDEFGSVCFVSFGESLTNEIVLNYHSGLLRLRKASAVAFRPEISEVPSSIVR